MFSDFFHGNIFSNIPEHLPKELFEPLLSRPGFTLTRILTQGQSTDWLDQDEGEWVILLAGAAKLLFAEGNREITLKPGDYLCIPAHARHRVIWSDPEQKTIWLAVHYK